MASHVRSSAKPAAAKSSSPLLCFKNPFEKIDIPGTITGL